MGIFSFCVALSLAFRKITPPVVFVADVFILPCVLEIRSAKYINKLISLSKLRDIFLYHNRPMKEIGKGIYGEM